jgi:hypothetical protein
VKKNLLIAFFLGILLLVFGSGLFIFYAGKQLARGALLFGISEELLANPPIASEPGIADRIEHGINPIPLLKHQPTGAGNAATYYIEVVRSVSTREAEAPTPSSQARTDILTRQDFETFLEGARQANCDFSAEALVLNGKPVRLAPAVDFADNLAHISWFRKIARAAIDRGAEFETESDPEMARQYYEAAIKFGVDIEAGRESILQVFMGVAAQKMGAEKLRDFLEQEGEIETARQWDDYLDDLETYISKFKSKTNTLVRSAGLTRETVANGLWILEHDADPLFKRETLATLRVAKVLAPDIVDPVLEEIARNDPDPYVREAAKISLNMDNNPEARTAVD